MGVVETVRAEDEYSGETTVLLTVACKVEGDLVWPMVVRVEMGEFSARHDVVKIQGTRDGCCPIVPGSVV